MDDPEVEDDLYELDDTVKCSLCLIDKPSEEFRVTARGKPYKQCNLCWTFTQGAISQQLWYATHEAADIQHRLAAKLIAREIKLNKNQDICRELKNIMSKMHKAFQKDKDTIDRLTEENKMLKAQLATANNRTKRQRNRVAKLNKRLEDYQPPAYDSQQTCDPPPYGSG